MNEITSSTAESSLLMWALSMVVMALTVHVGLGWVRAAQRDAALARSWRALLIAAGTLGTGFSAAVILALAAEALSFPLGFHAVTAPALWLGGVAACLPLALWLSRSQAWPALMTCGLLLTAVIVALQWGWIEAAGFRPGIRWRVEIAAAAAVLEGVGFSIVLWMVFARAVQESGRRTLWQVGAAVAAALTLLAGQLLLAIAAQLATQVGSVYLRQLPASVLSLVCGVLLPLALVVMALDLTLRLGQRRRRSRGDPSAAFSPQRRRKRRHRIRSL